MLPFPLAAIISGGTGCCPFHFCVDCHGVFHSGTSHFVGYRVIVTRVAVWMPFLVGWHVSHLIFWSDVSAISFLGLTISHLISWAYMLASIFLRMLPADYFHRETTWVLGHSSFNHHRHISIFLVFRLRASQSKTMFASFQLLSLTDVLFSKWQTGAKLVSLMNKCSIVY